MEKEKGWKPIPLSLKILFIIFILWIIGSIFAIKGRYDLGLPFFGIFVYGIVASFIVLILDIIGPILFLIGLWNKKTWAPIVALTYISIFILNSLVAIFTIRDELGFIPILIPLLFNVVFLIIIYSNKKYFNLK